MIESQEKKELGDMDLSENLRRRAIEVAREMKNTSQTSSPIVLFEEGEKHEGDGRGIMSISADNISIALGSIEFEGTQYFIGLPKNGS